MDAELRPELRREIAAVFGEIAAARKMVGTGRAIELVGLDSRVAAICEAIVALPQVVRRELLPLLEDLQGSLDQLGAAIRRSQPAPSGSR